MKRTAALAALVATITLCWIVAMPPSSGPDEPGHQVRAAALVRGELDGEWGDFGSAPRGFELPLHVGFPDPGCFAFQPFEPATCATDLDVPDGQAVLGTRSTDYPVWGHLLPGVGTFAGGRWSGVLSRVLDAALPVALVAASLVLARRRSQLQFAATLLAVTPLAWFTFAVVNPSGLVIAGGVALWTALLAPGLVTPSAHPERLERWLAGLGFAAMALPRRDGLVYAALVVAVVLLVGDLSARELWRRLGRGPQVLVAAATLVTLAWASRSDTTAVKALFLTPLAPLAAVALRAAWSRLPTGARATWWRAGFLAGVGVAGALGALVVMDQRRAGFDRAVFRTAVSRTGLNLDQAIGLLGWLDTPVPATAVDLWIVGLGLLAGGALLLGARRAALAGLGVLLSGIAGSWILTMLQNDELGDYWQGRYYLPYLAGVPILLAAMPWAAPHSSSGADRLASVVLVISLVVANVALAGAIRRFAVGIGGSYVPTDWDTYDALLPPVLLLAASLAASIGLYRWARPIPGPAGSADPDRRANA